MKAAETPVSQLAKRQIVKFLKSRGFVHESRSYIKQIDGITTGVTLWFVAKGKSDVSEFTVEVFGYSDRVAEIIDRKTAIGWELHLVSAVLPYMASRIPGDHFAIRKDNPEDVDSAVVAAIRALEDHGLPFLESIKTDHDIVRIMRDTPYAGFSPVMKKQLVAWRPVPILKSSTRMPDIRLASNATMLTISGGANSRRS